MGAFSINVKQAKKTMENEELLIKELANIELTISSMKGGVRLGSSTSQIRNRLASIAANVNDERQIMKEMKQCLESVNAIYCSTENKILGESSKKIPATEMISGVIGSIVAPGIAISAGIAHMLGIDTNKKNWLTDWLQNKIDGSNNAFIDLFGFQAKDKNKFIQRNDNLIKSLADSNLSDKNLLKKYADRLNSFNKDRERTGWKGYFDENGQYHNVKNADEKSKELQKYKDISSLKKEATIASLGTEVAGAIWSTKGEGSAGIASGSYEVAVGKVEGNASAYGGIFSYTEDGKKKFTPGFGAEIGLGATAFTASAKGAIGDEYFDVHGNASVSVGKVDGKAAVNVGIFDANGNINPKAKVDLSAEALLAEAKASAGVKIAGTDVGVTGGVNFGLGAHANVGFSDGKFSLDVGASLGVGVSVKLDIDFSGTVNAVSDMVKSIWPF